MTQEQNPFEGPTSTFDAAPQKPSVGRRVLLVFVVACLGIVIGSYISAELLHVHFPSEPRTNAAVLSNSIAAIIASPLGMSVGLLPTMSMCSEHGFIALLGVPVSIFGGVQYLRRAGWAYAVTTLVGFAMWSHNNLLGFQALMSV